MEMLLYRLHVLAQLFLLGYLLHSLPSSRRGDEKSDSSSKARKRGVQVYWLRGILCILQPKAQKRSSLLQQPQEGMGQVVEYRLPFKEK